MLLFHLLSSRLFGNVVQKILIPDVQKVRKIILFIGMFLDCEQSLFYSKIHGEERKTSERATMTVSVKFSVVQWSFEVHPYRDTSNDI